MSESKWILVNDRQPDVDGDYLVYTESGYIAVTQYNSLRTWLDDYDHETHWETYGSPVLFWQSLPEPPEVTK